MLQAGGMIQCQLATAETPLPLNMHIVLDLQDTSGNHDTQCDHYRMPTDQPIRQVLHSLQ